MIKITIIVTVLILTISAYKLNPKGPIHIKYASACIESLILENFLNINDQGIRQEDVATNLLLTVIITDNLTAPGHEIQEKSLKSINDLSKWGIQVINSKEINFQSRCSHRRRVCHFVPELKSHFYFMVVDSLEHFNSKVQMLNTLKTYNPKALFLIYCSNLIQNHRDYAKDIMLKLRSKLFFNVFVLMPISTLTRFELYSLDYVVDEGFTCGPHDRIYHEDTCRKKGKFTKSAGKYYQRRLERRFQNCTVHVRANAVEPFVIDDDKGIEIELLQLLSAELNISFDVTLTKEESWGEKVRGVWTNGLSEIYNRSASVIGIGNIAYDPDYLEDFDLTDSYYQANLIWIVPRANFVPKWRVLTVIFTPSLWGICLGLIIIIATLLYLTSRHFLTTIEHFYYQSFENDLLISYQLIIMSSVFKQPKADLIRLIFLSLAIFSIVISSGYTSSLINYLKTPQREVQISTIDDILSSGLHIKSLPLYQSIFNNSKDEMAMRIYDLYEPERSVNENIVSELLNRVALKRDIAFIYSELFVKYKLANPNNSTRNIVDRQKRPQIYILKKKIYSYTLSVMTKRGYPLTDKFSKVIRDLNAAGLVARLEKKYLYALEGIKYDDGSTTVSRLSMDNLQGAFSIIFLGYIVGVVIFFIEICIDCIQK